MSEIDTAQAAREYIDGIHDTIILMGQEFSPGRAYQELDPIGFRTVELDLIDSNVKAGEWFDMDPEVYDDELEALESVRFSSLTEDQKQRLIELRDEE